VRKDSAEAQESKNPSRVRKEKKISGGVSIFTRMAKFKVEEFAERRKEIKVEASKEFEVFSQGRKKAQEALEEKLQPSDR
jgi:hypothetical protein